MENIAVVGIANLFPGSSAPEEFWQQLLTKQDCRSKATNEQMGADVEKYTGKKGDTDKFYCVHGGYIRNFNFDAQPFCDNTNNLTSNDLTSEYLNQLDDLNKWSLYVTQQALVDAGYWQSEKLANCGVILGNLSFPTKSSNHLFMPLYHQVVDDTLKQVVDSDFNLTPFSNSEAVVHQGLAHETLIHEDNALVAGYPAALLAKAAGLGGSHFALDAACASSCYSVKLACDYLHTGKADMMLAGAVSGADPMFVNMGFSIFQAYPANNIHAPFDKNSQGLFAGEGAGMMVLKRHSDAVRDGDKIHAIIKGGALSNDGKGEFVLSPNTKGQVLVYERAYENAAVNPADVDYIECHATGTPKGDNVELGSMETFFSRYGLTDEHRDENKPLLGSVKSNLGHLLTAAGMPGMTKAIRALNEGKIPATINLNEPLSSKEGYFGAAQMPTQTVDWPTKSGAMYNPKKPRTAGVSVFGFGGSNAHLVLQQPTQVLSTSNKAAKAVQPLAIVGMDAHFGSAHNLSAFKALLDNKTTTFRSLPPKRWKGINNNTNVMNALALNKAPMGGYVENFDIDFLRFKVPPNEQDCLIPQQLMMMKVADNAAKDANLTPGSNVAVLVAMGLELELHQYRGRVNLTTQIEDSLLQQGVELSLEQRETLTNIAKDGIASAAQLNQYTSFIGNIMASRISALWDFSGPAITVSAEENSVYRCVELAQNLFQTSDVDAVIIAGVDLAGSIENITLRQHFGEVDTSALAQQLSSDSSLLDGSHWKVGEGAAAFVVKSANDPSINDSITGQGAYATIDGIAFVNDTSAQAIAQAAKNALGQANINTNDISQVEAHNSGFIAENEAEKLSLPALYQGKTISSVKSQVGHTFNASGAASIIKVALALSGKSLNNSIIAHSAINGLAKDGSCAHLILSSSVNARRQATNAVASAEVKKRPQLIKTITLGGNAIDETIITSSQQPDVSSQFSAMKLAFNNRRITPVLKDTHVDKIELAQIKPRFSSVKNTAQQAQMKQIPQTTQSNDIELTGSSGATVNKTTNPNVITKNSNPTLRQNLSQRINAHISQETAVHKAFLTNRQLAQAQISKMLALQVEASLDSASNRTAKAVNMVIAATSAETTPASTLPVTASQTTAFQNAFQIKGPAGYSYAPLQLKERFNKPSEIIWDTADLVEFAEGDIGNVFGEDYRIIDSYSRRVRLPTTDYLLVSRVTALDATVNEYKKSYMCTEYDIPVNAPFLIDGQIPWSVSVESGQCDLLLIAYIGIDFQAKGERVYRLLDCELTFLEEMAFGGETLRYEIHIDSYARNGEQLLFFFHYDCYVGDKKVLIMRNGCAGFFTDEELKDGKGVIHNDTDKAQLANAKKSAFTPLLQRNRDTYDYADMMKLVNGDVAGCFGSDYDQKGRNPSLKFSSKKFLMIERITKVNAAGGHWGLGLLEGQKDLDPAHWYFPCHFKDDQVMAGSLMSEGCGQMAMFYMLSLGMHSGVNNARFQPMPGESQTVRCRGQVLPQHNTLTYRMEVTEMGMNPFPFLKANIDIILDGKVVVDFKNLSVMITEQDDNSPYPVTLPDNVKLVQGISEVTRDKQSSTQPSSQSINAELDERGIAPFKHAHRPLMKVMSDLGAPKEKGVTPIQHFEAPMVAGQNRVPNQAPFTPWHMFEFATGNISKCFGPDFDVYKGRIPPRTPCGDLQVVTQVVEVQGERLDLKNKSSCIAEYYVPSDAWYFTKNSHEGWMPYSLIMEIALQPNGFISGYMGTTLKYPEKDLFFRNLDGSGDLIKQVDLRGKTIVNKSVLLSTTMAGGMIIQSFTFELYVKDEAKTAQDIGSHELFYKGTAVFGYFGADALLNQLGIDNGKVTHAWFVDKNTPKADIKVVDLKDQTLALYQAPANKPHYKLAGGQMNFIDTVSIVEGGGKAGIAYVHGERTIDATDWFFRYHFHQDPVMPGSLGVEAIIELMQTYALKNDLGKSFTNPRFSAPNSVVKWKYRGQITPLNKQMSLDVHITDIITNTLPDGNSEVRLVGDANLSKDGLRIYEVKDIVLSLVEA